MNTEEQTLEEAVDWCVLFLQNLNLDSAEAREAGARECRILAKKLEGAMAYNNLEFVGLGETGPAHAIDINRDDNEIEAALQTRDAIITQSWPRRCGQSHS